MIYHGPTAYGQPLRYWLRPWKTLGEMVATIREREAFTRMTRG